MKKSINFIALLISALIFVSCASGTAFVTGTQRPATNPESVIIYAEAPEKAVAELKKQAAKIGANGIILGNISTSNSGGVFVGNVWVNGTAQNISGTAIYVEE